MEIVPREVVDIVREAFNDTTERRRLIDDSVGLETLNDAVFNPERVSSSVLCDVKAENLLFIFS